MISFYTLRNGNITGSIIYIRPSCKELTCQIDFSSSVLFSRCIKDDYFIINSVDEVISSLCDVNSICFVSLEFEMHKIFIM